MTKEEINKELEKVKKEKEELIKKEKSLMAEKQNLEKEQKRSEFRRKMFRFFGECLGEAVGQYYAKKNKNQIETLVYVSDYMDE